MVLLLPLTTLLAAAASPLSSQTPPLSSSPPYFSDEFLARALTIGVAGAGVDSDADVDGKSGEQGKTYAPGGDPGPEVRHRGRDRRAYPPFMTNDGWRQLCALRCEEDGAGRPRCNFEPDDVAPGDCIFVDMAGADDMDTSSNLALFDQYYDQIRAPFVLITGRGDFSAPASHPRHWAEGRERYDYLHWLEAPALRVWFAVNCYWQSGVSNTPLPVPSSFASFSSSSSSATSSSFPYPGSTQATPLIPEKLHCLPHGLENRYNGGDSHYFDMLLAATMRRRRRRAATPGAALSAHTGWTVPSGVPSPLAQPFAPPPAPRTSFPYSPLGVILVDFPGTSSTQKPDRANAHAAIVANIPGATFTRGLTVAAWTEHVISHQFVVCPEGHGSDTLRLWEVLLMGGFCVVRSSELNSLYEDLPVLIVEEWAHLSPQLLAATFDEFEERARRGEWDERRLWRPHWAAKIATARAFCLANALVNVHVLPSGATEEEDTNQQAAVRLLAAARSTSPVRARHGAAAKAARAHNHLPGYFVPRLKTCVGHPTDPQNVRCLAQAGCNDLATETKSCVLSLAGGIVTLCFPSALDVGAMAEAVDQFCINHQITELGCRVAVLNHCLVGTHSNDVEDDEGADMGSMNASSTSSLPRRASMVDKPERRLKRASLKVVAQSLLERYNDERSIALMNLLTFVKKRALTLAEYDAALRAVKESSEMRNTALSKPGKHSQATVAISTPNAQTHTHTQTSVVEHVLYVVTTTSLGTRGPRRRVKGQRHWTHNVPRTNVLHFRPTTGAHYGVEYGVQLAAFLGGVVYHRLAKDTNLRWLVVVDDDTWVNLSAVERLIHRGWGVESAHSGENARGATGGHEVPVAFGHTHRGGALLLSREATTRLFQRLHSSEYCPTLVVMADTIVNEAGARAQAWENGGPAAIFDMCLRNSGVAMVNMGPDDPFAAPTCRKGGAERHGCKEAGIGREG